MGTMFTFGNSVVWGTITSYLLFLIAIILVLFFG